jgi:hypothetical protein
MANLAIKFRITIEELTGIIQKVLVVLSRDGIGTSDWIAIAGSFSALMRKAEAIRLPLR